MKTTIQIRTAIRRQRAETYLLFTLLSFAASFVIIAFSRTLYGFLAAAAVNAFGYGVCYPAVQSMSMNSANKRRRGAAASTSYLGADFAMLFGPQLAGLCIDKIAARTVSSVTAYTVVFCLMTIPILLCLAYFFLVRRKIDENIRKNADIPEAQEV